MIDIEQILQDIKQFEQIHDKYGLFQQIDDQLLSFQKQELNLIQEFLYNKLNTEYFQKVENILMNLEDANKVEYSQYQYQKIKKNIQNLGSDDAQIRKSSHNLNQKILQLCNNFDLFFQFYIKYGIENQNWVIRQKSINSLQSLIVLEKQRINFDSEILIKLIENLLDKLNDENSNVIKASEQTLSSFYKMSKFQKIINKFQQFIQEKLKNLFEPKNDEMIKTIQSQKFLAQKQTDNQMNFQKIIDNLKQIQDWKIKLNNIEELDKFVDSMNINDTQQINIILEHIILLIDDQNFKISITSINILNKLTKNRQLPKLQEISQLLLSKLKDSKQAIRQQCQNIIQQMFQNQDKIPKHFWFNLVLNQFENQNTLTKENYLELLQFFINNTLKQELQDILEKLIYQIFDQFNNEKSKIKNLIVQILQNLIKIYGNEQIENIIQYHFQDDYNNLLFQCNNNGQFSQIIKTQYSENKMSNFAINKHSPLITENNTFQVTQFQSFDSEKNSVSGFSKFQDSQKLSENTFNNYQYQSTTASSQISGYSRKLFDKTQQKENITEQFFRISQNQQTIDQQSFDQKYNSAQLDIEKQNNVIEAIGQNCEIHGISYKNLNNSPKIDKNEIKTDKKVNIYKPQIKSKTNENKKRQSENTQNLVIESKEYTNQIQKQDDKYKYYSKDVVTECLKEKEDSDTDSNYQQTKKQSENKTKHEQHYKQAIYQTFDDLKPLQKPQQDIKTLIQNLKTDDWESQFDAFDMLRCIIKYNPEIIQQNNISMILGEILKHVDNLRSGLAKNALITLQEICQTFQKQLDGQIEKILIKIFKKGQDNNEFIYQQVHNCMISLCQNCTDTKIILCLQTQYQSIKTPAGKVLLILGLKTIIQNYINKISTIKDLQKIIQILANYTFDGNAEVRQNSKQLFLQIYQSYMSKDEFNKILQKCLTENLYYQIQNFLASNKDKNNPFIITNQKNQNQYTSSNKNLKSTMKSTSTINKESDCQQFQDDLINTQNLQKKSQSQNTNRIKAPQEIEDIDQVFQLIFSQDWKMRFKAINQMQNIAEKYGDYLQKSKYIAKYLDQYSKLMADQNTKVAIQSLISFQTVISYIKCGIEQNIQLIIDTIFNSLGSMNSQIRGLSEEIIQIFYNIIEPQQFIQTIMHGIQFSIHKAKVINQILENLSNFDEKVSKQYLLKNVLPLTLKLCEDNKKDIKNASIQLLQQLSEIFGKNAIFQAVPLQKQNLVANLL